MSAIVIRVTHVTCGDPNAPVAFFAADAASLVRFTTAPGLTPSCVYAALFHLWEGAINPVYNPVSGGGSFLTLDADPDIASYEVTEDGAGSFRTERPDPDDDADDDDWQWLPEELLSAGRTDAPPACGWLQLYELAGMEGELLAMRALHRIRGGFDDPLRRQMYITAAGYVDFMHGNRQALTPQAAGLAREVDATGCDISARDWRWCLSEMAYIHREDAR